MRARAILVPLAVSAVGVVGMAGAASSAPLTRQEFTITFDVSQDEGGGPVVATGAINATGEDVVVSDTEDLFVFPDGTLTIAHAPVRTHERFNPTRCTGHVGEMGTYVITAGTDQYEGVSGSGTYRVIARFQSDCESEQIGRAHV